MTAWRAEGLPTAAGVWDYDALAPAWLPGAHAQTIWPALFGQRHAGPPPRYRRERWETPDGDFIDVDFLAAAAVAGAPWLLLFHGLEGSSQSHYALAFADWARRHGWHFAVAHFRGCSGEINRAPRAYHSGDHEEVDWIIRQFRLRCATLMPATAAPVIGALGVSLGGNALMRWAGEAGAHAASVVNALAAVSSPLDVAAGGMAIVRGGINRAIYNRMFMRTLRGKALAKWAQYPNLFDRERLLLARDLQAFDDVFTGPVHGFSGVGDYWRRASARPHLHRVAVPTLILNALNDPFVPADSLPQGAEISPQMTTWRPKKGGHVGFASSPFPGQLGGMPEAVGGWFAAMFGWGGATQESRR